MTEKWIRIEVTAYFSSDETDFSKGVSATVNSTGEGLDWNEIVPKMAENATNIEDGFPVSNARLLNAEEIDAYREENDD